VTSAGIVGIYRCENAEHVRRLIEPGLARGWKTAWWGLDGIHGLLEDVTVGEGPGLKLPLLNETLRRLDSRVEWTVVSDDDLRFLKGDVVRLVTLCDRAGLDLAQPARAFGTQRSHEITAAVRRSRARATTFVESGPLFVVGPRFRDRILPLPEQRGMGWGVEIDWHDLRAEGCRLGIVDATPIEHLGDWGEDYDFTDMRRDLLAELETHGHPMWAGMRETLEVWRPWQTKPRWDNS
jgi:hypothetical protein